MFYACGWQHYITVVLPTKLPPESPKCTTECPKFQNFPGGACPQTPLHGCFAAYPPMAGWSTPIHVTYLFNNLRTGLEYASHYKVHEFAMMMANVRPGSFIITWFIPESIAEKLKGKVPVQILKKYLVTTLTVAGVCVYCDKTEVTQHDLYHIRNTFSLIDDS